MLEVPRGKVREGDETLSSGHHRYLGVGDAARFYRSERETKPFQVVTR